MRRLKIPTVISVETWKSHPLREIYVNSGLYTKLDAVARLERADRDKQGERTRSVNAISKAISWQPQETEEESDGVDVDGEDDVHVVDDSVHVVNLQNVVCDVCGERGYFLSNCDSGGKQIVKAIGDLLDQLEMSTKAPDTLGRILSAVKKAKGIPPSIPFRPSRFRREADGNRSR
jgi:hypothetical protein